jgi:hypothetical protein
LAVDNSSCLMYSGKQKSFILTLSIFLSACQLQIQPVLAAGDSAPVLETINASAGTAGKKSKNRRVRWMGLPFSPFSHLETADDDRVPDTKSPAGASAPAAGSGEPGKAKENPAASAGAGPPATQIVVLPFLVAGHTCTLSVVDAQRRPLAFAGVYLNADLQVADERGTLSFRVPESESFELALLGEGKKKTGRRKFSCSAGGVFAENDKLSDMVSSLLRLPGTTGSAPLVVYAPALLSPDQEFVLVGRNFSEKIADDYVDVDGLSARILSASQDGVLAVAPGRMSLGPLREIFMTVNGQASNSSELDIAAPFFTHVKTEADDVSPQKGKIGMNGSDLPCLLQVLNNSPETVSLFSPKQEPMGRNNIVIIPGGAQNYLNVDLRLQSPATEPKLDLICQQLLPATAGAGAAPGLMLKAVCRAEIMLLERRRVSECLRLDELAKEESSAEQKALSMRLVRVSRMLAARRAIYESLGGTDAQYRQALDEACGGALYSLEQSIKPIQIINDGSVGAAAADLSSESLSKKGRPLRLLEPAIRLLPPMNDEQAAIMALKRQSAAGVLPAAEDPAALTDEPTLRPGLPEPEPEVSAANRGQPPQASTESSGSAKQSKKEKPEAALLPPAKKAKETAVSGHKQKKEKPEPPSCRQKNKKGKNRQGEAGLPSTRKNGRRPSETGQTGRSSRKTVKTGKGAHSRRHRR